MPKAPLVEGYAHGFPPGSIKQRMDSGYLKVRRRGAGPEPLSAMFDGQIDVINRIRRFWKEDTNFGTRPFWCPDWDNNGTALTDEAGNTITDELGNPITVVAWWLVMFVGEPSPPVLIGPTWFKVAIQLDILPA